MHNLLTFGDLSDFIRKLINSKAIIRVYDSSGYAEEITIVGMITIKGYPDVLVQYVVVDDEDVDDALKKYVSCGYISNLFANGFDIFKDDQYYEDCDNLDNDESQYCFDPRDSKAENYSESESKSECEEPASKAKENKTTKEELEELEDAIAELMAAIFDPQNYSSKKVKDFLDK